MTRLSKFEILVLLLVIIGGLNWGLVGILNFNLVTLLFGEMSILSRTVYALVGLSAIAVAFLAIYDSRHKTGTEHTH